MLTALALVLAFAQAPHQGLTGKVQSPDGVPIAGARVVLLAGDRSEIVTTGVDGTFTLASATLPASLVVSAPGFATTRVTAALSPRTVELVPAFIAESVIVTPSGPTDLGRVVDPGRFISSRGTMTIDRADLDRIPAVTLDETLRVVSGFSLFRRSSSRASNPTTHGVSMRGLSASGSSRALVVAEGVPLNDGFGGWVTWSRLPDVAIQSVDAQRGPEGEAFGSDALGGVIRITPANGRVRSFRFDGEAGSFGTGSVDLAAGARPHGVALFGAASWFDTTGTIPLEPASQGPVDQPTDTHWTNGFGRVELGSALHHLTFAGWGGSERRGNGTVLQRNDSSGGTFTTSFDSAMKEFTVAARAAITPNHFYQTFSTVAPSRATEVLTQAQTIDATTTRAVLEVGRSIPKGLVIARAGLNRAHADFDVATAAATTTQALRDDSEALSVQAQVDPRSNLTIGGGIRHEWRAAPTSTDANKGATVGRVTASLSQQGPSTFRGSIATSHRWPTLNELVRGFQAGSVITNPNPDLKPERAVSFDGAAAVQVGHGNVSVGGFHAVIDDAIANVTLSSGKTIIRQRQNAGEAHATGLEVDGDQRIGSHLILRGSLTVVNALFVNSLEPALEGNKLPQIPKVSGALDAAITLPHGIGGSVVWHDVSSQYDDDRNQFLLARASQVDARVTGRVGHFGWMVTGENLFDARIEVGKTPLVTLAPGRAARAGVSLRW